jgi:hypothetical protein
LLSLPQQVDKDKEIAEEILLKYKLFDVLAEHVFAACTLSSDTCLDGLNVVEMMLSLKAFRYFNDFEQVYALFERSGCLTAVESL